MEKDTDSTSSRDGFDLVLAQILSRNSSEARSIFGFIERCLRQFNLSPRIEAYEILVEAYLRGHRYLESGATIAYPLAWLRKTAFNIIREHSRQASKEQLLDPSQIESLPSRDEVLEPESFKDELATLRRASEVLGQQDPEALKILYLRNIKGLSWKEVQASLETEAKNAPTEATLRQRGTRAMKRLREIFHEIQSSSN